MGRLKYFRKTGTILFYEDSCEMDEYRLVEEMMVRADRLDSALNRSTPSTAVTEVTWSDADEKRDDNLFALEEIFNALGSRQRLEIIDTLRQHAKTPSDVAFLLELPASTVSRHLRVLERAGLVITRQTGRRREITLVVDIGRLLNVVGELIRRP